MQPRPVSASGGLLGGRYQVIKHLASGGMAEVHLARSTGIGGFERHVVIKQILPDHARDQRFVTMFLDEARLAAQLHHTNIAQVYDIGEEDGTYFFAMEYVHGEDARSLLRKVASARKHLPIEHVLAIVGGAAAGLHYAHEKRGSDRQPLGLVHRDVSPSNILVAYDGAVKVVDFGIAKAASRTTETRSGTLKGKVAYMSPEQCLGKPLDRRSDVFALGIVLYELSTLTRLFKAENDYVTMHQIVQGEIPLPSKRRADYPAGLEPIVMKALAKDPAARYATAGELGDAIERLAAEQRLAMSPAALGRYVTELFGARPEPWLDPDAGTPAGHVSLKDAPDDDDAPRAQTDSMVAPRYGTASATEPTVATVPSAPSVTTPPRRARRWPWIAALVVVSASAGGVIAVTRRSDSPSAPAPAPSPSTSTSPSTTEPTPTPTPTPTTTTIETPKVVVEAPQPEPAKPAPIAKKKPTARKPKPTAEAKPVEAVTPPVNTGRDTSVLIRPSQKKKEPTTP